MAELLREAARQALPPVEGEIAGPVREPVEVMRDRWGVPHIYASNLDDLFFAQGYVVASERLFQLELLVRIGMGRLSELFSELTLPIDRFVRTVGWNRAARRFAERWDDRSREMSAAFSAGLRHWVATMPAKPVEYQVLDAEPWAPDDEEAAVGGAAGGILLAWSLSRNWDHELLRAEIAERLGVDAMRELFPDLDTEAPIAVAGKEAGPDRIALLRDAILPPAGQGSNNWVVAGSRTESGKPLLANDPHLAVAFPSVWFECHLSAPGIDVRGVTLPFAPGVVIGHNDRIAWGFTNTEGDVQDLYLERLSEDGTQMEYRGGWEPLATHREEIAVRGHEEPEILEVRESRHGPLLDAYMIGIADPVVIEGGIKRSYALRWVAADHAVQPSTVLNLNTARNWDEFREAVRGWECPGQNMVYADVDGNIGYQCTGLYPLRRSGDGTVPVPGWTDEYEWDGWVPFDDLPRAYNPDEGFLCTANNKIHDDAYPYDLGRDFLPPFRVRRIAQLITERERHTAETFRAMQTDTVSLPAEAIVPHLVGIEPADDRQKQALALLGEWDRDVRPDSAAAALYEVWCEHVARLILQPLLGDELFTHFHGRRQWTNAFQYQVLPTILRFPTARWFGGNGAAARDDLLRRALDGALDELAARLGDDPSTWRWGALHRATFAGRLALIPDLAELFTGGVVELGGDEQTLLQGNFEPGAGYDVSVCPSWRQVVDLGDLDASAAVFPGGQSGNPASPHFADQLELWGRGELHPMPFSRGAVEAAADAMLRLVPGRDPGGG
ncbi:MAG TPA: penicillin acylase family protein [Actinomycetota bacterium]|nr:penicillin acylase family protein [Actinomycetota bacterium]